VTHGEVRPAFYALAQGGWRDYLTLLHPPYTLWHVSYVAIGAGLAPELGWDRLVFALLAFFLAVGIGAHALDELQGRPLQTRIPSRTLWALGATSISVAVAIGIAGAFVVGPWLLAFVAFGGFIVVAYNLELFGGRFHGPWWFALAWGGFPLLTGYFAAAGNLSDEAVVAAAFATLLSLAQQRLSTPVRTVRRRVVRVSGAMVYKDGREEPITRETLTGANESALRALAAATAVLAVALVLTHVA
jgi:hypothetical protein